MLITDIQADLPSDLRKPRKVRKELRVLIIRLLALYYIVGHEGPNFFLDALLPPVKVGTTYRSKCVK
jgi:hypothetical protein